MPYCSEDLKAELMHKDALHDTPDAHECTRMQSKAHLMHMDVGRGFEQQGCCEAKCPTQDPTGHKQVQETECYLQAGPKSQRWVISEFLHDSNGA